MSTTPVTIINVASLSYTGTTWFNLLLGSHSQAFTLGPPERVWRMRQEGWDKACLIHGEQCEFWPRFFAQFNPKENFFVQLADYSGKSHIVINNPFPNGAGAELNHPRIVQKHIQFVRDNRAVTASYLRKNPDKSALQAVTEFLCLGLNALKYDANPLELFQLRYEDLLADPAQHLAAMGAFVGLDYAANAAHYWEYEHHITSGNSGPLRILKMARGGQIAQTSDADFYRQQVNQGEVKSFNDARWQSELSEQDLFFIDFFCGHYAEQLGYTRDKFTIAATLQYLAELKAAYKAKAFTVTFVPATIQKLLSSTRTPAVNPAPVLQLSTASPQASAVTLSWRRRVRNRLAKIPWLRSAKRRLSGWLNSRICKQP